MVLEYWCTLVGSRHGPLIDLSFTAWISFFSRVLLEWLKGMQDVGFMNKLSPK